jgi:hypothetical protein
VPELQSPLATQRSQLPTTRGLRQGVQSAVTLTQAGPTLGVPTVSDIRSSVELRPP